MDPTPSPPSSPPLDEGEVSPRDNEISSNNLPGFTKPKFPTKTRILNHIPPPAANRLDPKIFWVTKTPRQLPNNVDPTSFSKYPEVNLPALKDHLLREGRLHHDDILKLVRAVTQMLREEPTLLDVPLPITIAGDIHGQFYDLINLFNVGGELSVENPYLFLGDYVDRAMFSCECVFWLYACKLMFPQSLWLLRGNHESRLLTADFSFKTECLRKYNLEIYDAIMDSFDCLPLACLLNKSFLCVHGGLSPELQTLDDIRKINRFQEVPAVGLMCDLLWSDPVEDYATSNLNHFIYNEPRMCSYNFPYRITCQFLAKNRLLSVIRGHEVQQEGYRMYRPHGPHNFPSVICLFSAPRYHDVWNNKGAILKYSNQKMDVLHFDSIPHPYLLPNFQDVFSWSLPFVAGQIADIFTEISRMLDLEGSSDDDEEEEIPENQVSEAVAALNADLARSAKRKRERVIKSKIRSISRYRQMFDTLRQEHETITQIKQFHAGKIPKGLLMDGPTAINAALGTFERNQMVLRDINTAIKHEAAFEKRPDYAAGTPPAAAVREAALKAQEMAKRGEYMTLYEEDEEEILAASKTMPAPRPAPVVGIHSSNVNSSLKFNSTSSTSSFPAAPQSTSTHNSNSDSEDDQGNASDDDISTTSKTSEPVTNLPSYVTM